METNPLWPKLNYDDWLETYRTLHRWTQIVGKIRLSKSPVINHSWGSTLYVTSRGLTSSVIHDGSRSFEIDFDFLRHVLRVVVNDGRTTVLPLESESVAAFHDKCLGALRSLDIDCAIHEIPNELEDAIPFAEDRMHCRYQPEFARRFGQILLRSDEVMKKFRARFIGKCSPVHFFWGSFDLAVTRFSGRRAPAHPGGVPHLPDLVAREAYSHEVSSCGFWPGNARVPFPAFYSYAYPEPAGLRSAHLPEDAYYDPGVREFILPYDAVRTSARPNERILDFFQSCYDAAAELGNWDREALEDSPFLSQLQQKAA